MPAAHTLRPASQVAGRRDHNNYKSFDYEDAHLTPEGWRQAHALGEHVRSAGLRPQLVVVSPLARAIETAVGAFGDPSAAHSSSSNGGSGGGGGDSNGNGGGGAGGLLMAALPDVPGKCTPHAAVPLGGAPPFLCMELCREHLGVRRGAACVRMCMCWPLRCRARGCAQMRSCMQRPRPCRPRGRAHMRMRLPLRCRACGCMDMRML